MNSGKILALETSTHICSVAFQNSGGEISEKRTEHKGSHSELLFIFIRELMEECSFSIADLDTVLVSSGPGSYTGLRISASAVKGLLFRLDADIFAVNTLAGFAQAANEGAVHAVINARRKHLYHQKFVKAEGYLSTGMEPAIRELDNINEALEDGDQIIGTGIKRLSEKKLNQLIKLDEKEISAVNLIDLFSTAEGMKHFKKTTTEQLESNYLSSSQVNNTNIK